MGRPQVCPFCGSRYWDTPRGEAAPTPEPEKPKETKRFLPPGQTEVQGYWAANLLAGNPDEFFDFYSSKGWKVGTAAMKSWQAAARNWSRRELKRQIFASPTEIRQQAAAAAGTLVQGEDPIPETAPPPTPEVEFPRGNWSESDVQDYLKTHPGANAEAIWASFNRVKEN